MFYPPNYFKDFIFYPPNYFKDSTAAVGYILKYVVRWKRDNPFPHTTFLQQTTWNIFFSKNREISIIEWITYDFLCYYILKKPSAAEASESVYMRESSLISYRKGHLNTHR